MKKFTPEISNNFSHIFRLEINKFVHKLKKLHATDIMLTSYNLTIVEQFASYILYISIILRLRHNMHHKNKFKYFYYKYFVAILLYPHPTFLFFAYFLFLFFT